MNAKEVFEFDKTSEVWKLFNIKGKDMKNILEHNVLNTMSLTSCAVWAASHCC